MDPQRLLEQFLGPNAGQTVGAKASAARDRLASSGVGGIAGGVAAGGLMGLLLGSKKARKSVGKLAGGVVGYGGSAALGALAYRAYQNWQDGRQAAGTATIPASAPAGAGVAAAATAPPPTATAERFLPGAAPAKDGRPFELALVLAMIAAANADGHIGSDEQRTIFDQVGRLPLDAEAKGFVFDALRSPPGLREIAGLAEGPEQAAELYLASRLAIDPDHPAEQAYLEALAGQLSLPGDLVAQLESQVAAAVSTAA